MECAINLVECVYYRVTNYTLNEIAFSSNIWIFCNCMLAQSIIELSIIKPLHLCISINIFYTKAESPAPRKSSSPPIIIIIIIIVIHKSTKHVNGVVIFYCAVSVNSVKVVNFVRANFVISCPAIHHHHHRATLSSVCFTHSTTRQRQSVWQRTNWFFSRGVIILIN